MRAKLGSMFREYGVFIAVVVAVFFASPLHLPLNNPNEGVRVFVAKALVEHGTFAIDDVVREWGYIDDKAKDPRTGKLYSSKAPLASMIGAAAYAPIHVVTGDLSRPALTRLCRGAISIVCLALAFIAWRGLRRRVHDVVIADLALVGLVLGSGVLASLNVFSGHALAALAPAAVLTLLNVGNARNVGGGRAQALPEEERALLHAGNVGGGRAPALAEEERASLHAGNGGGGRAPALPLEGTGDARDARDPPDVTAERGTSAVAHGERSARWPLVVVGAALAAAVGCEYPALVVAVPLGALGVVMHRARGLAWMSAGAAPVIVAVCVAHTASFGAPWRTGYSFLENKQYQSVVEGTLFGIGAPNVDVLYMVTFSAAVGLFFFSPFLAAGLASLALPSRISRITREERVAVVVALALLMLFIAGFRGWRGGWSVGPRYISEAIGLLTLPSALFFAAVSNRGRTVDLVVARAAFAALVAIGVVCSGIAGMFFPHLPDLYANPVHEMMLPVVARGLAPDNVALALGFSSSTSAFLCIAFLALPFIIAMMSQRSAPSRIALGIASVVVAVFIGIGPSLAVTNASAVALENRRALDNWRPESGNPFSPDVTAPDPRDLVAVDRVRIAWPRVSSDGGCALADRTSTLPLSGPLADDVARVARESPGSLVVVPDRFAFDIVGVRGAPVLVVSKSDVRRFRKQGMPCGNVVQLDVPDSRD